MIQKIINPATGEIIAEVSVMNEEDIRFNIDTARMAFDRGPWRDTTLEERKNYLLRISQGILDKAADLAKLETLNTGKPIKETTFMDIPSAAQTFAYFADNLERYLSDDTIQISTQLSQAQSQLIREPLGVVVLIVPWNYPLLIAAWKTAQALAAGNAVILKPSSLTPLTALELEKIIKAAGVPEGIFKVIVGSGESVGEILCSDKRIDLISFTGSNEVGKKILSFAARNVKKLIMELGGKSASIILEDANLETAVNGSLCSIFLNQGQMCTAMSRILVEDDIYDKFIADFVVKTNKIKLGIPCNYETQMGPLISRQQQEKVIDFVEKAKIEGAKLLCGGKIPDQPELKNGFFFEPTVLAEVKPSSAIFQEEIFGPVVCINKFSDFDEAIELANATDFALAACIWTKDIIAAQGLAKKINAGTIWINTYGMFYNELPYGGFKQSGFGKELGKEGFLEYTRLKNIIIDKSQDQPLVSYWYGF